MPNVPSAILFRIYGVTTSWKFENDALTYYKTHLKDYLANTWNDPNLTILVEELREQTSRERDSLGRRKADLPEIAPGTAGAGAVQDSIVKYIEARRRKPNRCTSSSSKRHLPALILIRSLVIASGLDSNELKAHVFKDVKPKLKEWSEKKIKLFSMSSAPPAGQMIFFKHTIDGDLAQYLEGSVSTTNPMLSASKTEPMDYKTIADAMIEETTERILFLTDRIDEAEAAIKAEMRALLVVREGKLGHVNLSAVKHRIEDIKVISSFAEITFA